MSIVIEEIESEGKQAFLHALAENPAIRLYEQLGFVLSHNFDFAVLLRESSSQAPDSPEKVH
jgi:predicted GNAT family acetyltransferase